MNNITEYVDRLVLEKGFGAEDPEVLAQIKKDITDRIEDRVNAVIATNIPPEKLDDFTALLDTGSEETIREFVQKEVPDIEERIAGELLVFKSEYLS